MWILLLLLGTAASCLSCPIWTIRNNATGQCYCGDSLGGAVSCDSQTRKVSLLLCYCMTYNEMINDTVVGSCLTMCTSRKTPTCQLQNEIGTNDVHRLNHEMCSFVGRDGQLCGSCMEGYGLPVYSHAIHCVKCNGSNIGHSIVKYMAVAFLPLTAFYFAVIVFKISITSGNMVGYILTSQLVTMPILIRAASRPENDVSMGTMFLIAYFSVWNLDFFRTMYTPFCIHPEMNVLQVLALDYLVGIYPLFLIVLTYVAVMVHDRYPIVVKLWKPIYNVFSCIRKEWDIRGSLVQAFATFMILSYVKILNVSSDLLFPVTLKTSRGQSLNQTFLFNNAQMVYFGEEHWPYGMLAIFMLSTFNLLPIILLMVYPCRIFQQCLTLLRIRSFILVTFMDAFQGCYRHRPKDRRYFAAVYLAVRVLFLMAFMLVRDGTIMAIYGCSYIILSILVTFTEPYITSSYNKIDILFFLLNGQAYLAVCLNVYLRPGVLQIPLHYLYVVTLMPALVLMALYGGAVITYKIIPRKVVMWIGRCYKFMKKKKDEEEERLPYRFEHETEATPLIT